jgi:hypothetical protein
VPRRWSGWTIVSVGTLLLSAPWAYAILVSRKPVDEALVLALVQVLLAATCLALAVSQFSRDRSSGPNIVLVLAVHGLMYYGVANVMPALLPERRPPELELILRIPAASVGAYTDASLAALMLIVSLAIGALVFRDVASHRRPRAGASAAAGRVLGWLPGYHVSVVCCVSLLGIVVVATLLFGVRFDATMLAEGVTSTFSPLQLAIWGGVFYFLPIAPFLAASAYVKADLHQRRSTRWLLIFAALLCLAALIVWRMRSTAMLSILLPTALLVYAGVLSLRRILLPMMAGLVGIYVLVTIVRLSQVAELVAASTGGSVSFGDIVSAIGSDERTSVAEKALFDLSYRAAGLEGVAAIIDAQQSGRVAPMMGRATLAGFAQGLPAALRGQLSIPERVKTAPAALGIFGEGDWVTTILAEQVLDFEPLLLVVPALLLGFLFALFDALLLMIGSSRPWLEGLLVLRIPWLLAFLLVGGSAGDLLVYFFKANAGYSVALLFAGVIGTAWARQRRSHRPVRSAPLPRHGLPTS